MTLFLGFLSGLVSLLVIDALMITGVILPLFRKYVPGLLRETPDFLAASLFYIFYIGVLLFGLVLPALRSGWDLRLLVLQAATAGFFAYMTYELTSMSVIRDWSWWMVVVDTTWWVILTVIITLIMYGVMRYF